MSDCEKVPILERNTDSMVVTSGDTRCASQFTISVILPFSATCRTTHGATSLKRSFSSFDQLLTATLARLEDLRANVPSLGHGRKNEA